MPTVLIVDSDERVAEHLSELLTTAGAEVKTAYVADDGVDAIDSGGIDLVITEMELPFRGANRDPDFIPGSRVLRKLAETKVPVIIYHSWKMPAGFEIHQVARFIKPCAVDKVAQKALEFLSITQPA